VKVNAAKQLAPNMSPASSHLGILALLDRYSAQRVVVIGDIMLDEYWMGTVERISPEAPVPVVAVHKQEAKLGGATNVAQNIRSLGGQVITVGVIGDDRAGELVRSHMADQGMSNAGLLLDRARPTTLKTRIVAHNQQVVRADSETTEPIAPAQVEELTRGCLDALRDASGLVISDYGKGVIQPELLSRVVPEARRLGKFIVVDPKDTHFNSYKLVTTLTPNHHEAGFVAGRRIRDDESLRSVGFELLDRLNADSLLITLGEKGMALFTPNRSLTRIPTVAKQVYDVTGAGDTVIATVAMTLAAGGTMLQAAYAANVAAGEVIKEIGTAQTTVDAIRHALDTIPEPQLQTS
jgi:D-beta-D-heptose 7-phosphate kinase/D-beta-D-heptose 1-phosphate adenosyltransferase